MQLALIILAFGFTTILAQTQPQCKCSDLNPCEDAEFKKGQDCLKNADCIKLLGGDAAKVGTCLDAK
uniref:Uncharacterized protein n=1 Tax=Plectus sambesii TaxID=2011161 RepID=A0A914WZ82_9BILA